MDGVKTEGPETVTHVSTSVFCETLIIYLHTYSDTYIIYPVLTRNTWYETILDPTNIYQSQIEGLEPFKYYEG